MYSPFLIILCIVITLSLFSLFTLILVNLRKDLDFLELINRLKYWWAMAFVFVFTSYIGPNVALISLAFLCTIVLKEYLSLISLKKRDWRLYSIAFFTIPLQFLWVFIGEYSMFIVFIPVFVFLFLPVCLLVIGKVDGFVKTISGVQWGIMLLVFGLSHLAYFPKISADGFRLVLFLVVLTQLNDVVRYMWVKLLGGKEIAPNAYLGKTWESIFASFIVTVIVAYYLSPILTPLSDTHSLLAGALISIGGLIGALNFSTLKRDLKVDSSENSFPKVAINLDKIDSLTYTAPLFFHFMLYFYF